MTDFILFCQEHLHILYLDIIHLIHEILDFVNQWKKFAKLQMPLALFWIFLGHTALYAIHWTVPPEPERIETYAGKTKFMQTLNWAWMNVAVWLFMSCVYALIFNACLFILTMMINIIIPDSMLYDAWSMRIDRIMPYSVIYSFSRLYIEVLFWAYLFIWPLLPFCLAFPNPWIRLYSQLVWPTFLSFAISLYFHSTPHSYTGYATIFFNSFPW